MKYYQHKNLLTRTPGKTWFPAVKKVEVLRAGRIQIVFMLTGEAVLVPVMDWLPYSPEMALELARDKVAGSGGYRDAMKEMLALMRSIEGEEEGEEAPGPISTSMPRGRARVQGNSSNQKLGAENAQNEAAFKAKIFKGEDGKFRCKNCPTVKLMWEFGARRHARMCGERPSVPRERSSVERHTCSVAECGARFASLGELHAHYRAQHPNRRPYKCPPCRKTFKCADSHKRHMLEQHAPAGKVVKVHTCCLCDFSTAREWYMIHHMRKKHREEYNLIMSGDGIEERVNEEHDVVGEKENDSEEVEEVEEVGGQGDVVEYVEEVAGGYRNR